jgi:hypothetical protein
MTDIEEIKKRFKSSLRRGTGEAYLILKAHPTLDFSTDIIKGAIKNYAYDGQSEGSRALYLSELIFLSRKQDKIRKAILHGLANEQKDTWALVQLFDLAAIYARKGDSEAKQAIYKRYYHNVIEGSEWCGYESIIALDGLEGLKYIATTIGKSSEKNPDNWEDSMIIRHFQDKNPKMNAMKELEKASKGNKYIKIYLDNVKRSEAGRENYQYPVLNIDTLKKVIVNSNHIFIPSALIESLKKADVKILAKELLVEKDKKRIGKYLCVFSKVKFPYDYQFLLKLAKARVSNKDRIAELAVDSLKYFSGDDIRKFALGKIKRLNSPGMYTKLLINNYKKGDGKLLKSVAEKCKTEDSIHALVSSYVAIYQKNKTKECKAPLESIYDKMNCGLHRKEIVELLIKNKVLSSKIKREIKHDSYEAIRKLKVK